MSDHDSTMTDDTTDDTDAQHTKDATPGAGTLAGLLLGGALGLGGVGTASADAQGQVGTSDDPLTALYTDELNGGVTGDQSVTSLTGDGLRIDANALSAAPARPDVDDGATSVTDASGLSFGQGLRVVDDGDGTVTVRLDRDLKWLQADKLESNDSDRRLGRATALDADGTTALIGQPNEASVEGRTVAAVEGGSGWNRQSSFQGSKAEDVDGFGNAVDLSADGTIGIVGAPQKRLGTGYVDILDGGSDWSSPTLEESYEPSDIVILGYSVALSDDGAVGFVGAPGYPNDDPDGEKGAVYVYDSGGTWSGTTRTTTLTASSPTTKARLGFSTAVDGDGTTAFVGAPYEPTEFSNRDGDPNDPGELYVYDGSGGWGSVSTETAIVTPDDSSNEDEFGSSVAVTTDGNLAFVGAPNKDGTGAVYVFDGSSGWDSATQVTKLKAGDRASDDAFGTTVAINGTATTAIVGAPGDDNTGGGDAGAAYVFDGQAGWSGVSTESQKITSGDLASGDRFGRAVGIGRDSQTALLGAPKDENSNNDIVGSAYAFYGTE